MANFIDFQKSHPSVSSSAKIVFDFIADPINVSNMVVMSDLKLSAITGIVEKMENNFANFSAFPLSSFTNRQIVGKMVKFILDEVGYIPSERNLDVRTRLRDFANAKYFKTNVVYKKSNLIPSKNIVVSII